MRRKDREITDFSKMTEIMKACDCCRLGLVDENEAYIVPMNFGFEAIGNNLVLYFHCAKKGRKTDILLNNLTATFEMDTKHVLTTGEAACDYSFLYQCIMGKGTVEFVTESSEKIYALNKIMKHYTSKDLWDYEKEMLNQTNVFKLFVEGWSCKEH